MSIEITNESGSPVDTDAVLAVARYTLDQMGVNPLAELSILLVDVDYMTELNHRWMGGEGPTDVLAFPMDEVGSGIDRGPAASDASEPALLGDIVLCPEVASRQAGTAGSGSVTSGASTGGTTGNGAPPSATAADEMHLLTVHGVLHILGYDHAEPDEEREMFALQNRLLEQWRAERSADDAVAEGRQGTP